MSIVINKINPRIRIDNAHTPDYPAADWHINPQIPECQDKYLITYNDVLSEMTDADKLIIDNLEIADAKKIKIAEIKQAAQSVILATYPEWKQRNYTGRGMDILAKIVEGGTLTADETADRQQIENMGAWIFSIRSQSDSMEADIESFNNLSTIKAYSIAYNE